MARPKSYDKTTALESAAQLFWSQGYDGTSMSDLEAGMGMGRQSIYNAFGDKQELFLKSLTHYQQSAGELMKRSLLVEGAAWAEIEAYFALMLAFVTPQGPRRGCLVTNSIMEADDSNEMVLSSCRLNQAKVLGALERALRNAVDADEISKELEIAGTARLLMAQTYGMTVLSKNGATRAELASAVETLLNSIRSKR